VTLEWKKIKEILASALERAPEGRAAFVQGACDGDLELIEAVQSMIAAEADGPQLVTGPLDWPSEPGAGATRPRLEGGARLGPYEVRRLLGEGGMGEVYRAHDARLGRDVAIKMLPWSVQEDSERRERFHREARALAALNHPNVLAIYDTGEIEGAPYLVCELLEGETLRERLREGPFATSRALHVAAEIARGLAAAHERGIVHRDLKPENVFLGPDERVKILDFGLAKLTGRDFADNRLGEERAATTPGMLMGTLAYMSPEQLQGGEIDDRTDLFALGAILYEMLTGRPAFRRRSAVETMTAILRDDPQAESGSGLTSAVELVGRCLAKRPDERVQSARELAVELDLAAANAIPSARARVERTGISALLVLPFADLGGDTGTDYLSDSLTETLINNLAQLPGLRVLARATAFRFKGSGDDPLAIGRRLDVDSVVTGRVLQVGERLVIRAELMSVVDGTQLWGEQYDRKRGDVLAIQDEIGRALTAALRLRLSPQDLARLDRRHSRSPEAYELYLRGRFFLNKRTTPAFEQAIQTFSDAVSVDPDYALAYSGLADASLLLERYGARPAREIMPRAKAAALRALEIDDALAEAHTSLGMISFYFDWDAKTMEREFRRAIELNPGYAQVHHWFGFNLGEMGRTEEALAQMDHALRLDPLSLIINTNRGTVLYLGRQFEAAVAGLQRTLELDPAFTVAHQWLGRALDQLGRHEEALAEHRRALELRPDDPECLGSYGHTCGLLGRTGEAQAILRRLDQLAQERYVCPYWYAVLSLGLGEEEQALDRLEEAYEHRFDWLKALGVEPLFDSLRAHPRFRDVLARVGQ